MFAYRFHEPVQSSAGSVALGGSTRQRIQATGA